MAEIYQFSISHSTLEFSIIPIVNRSIENHAANINHWKIESLVLIGPNRKKKTARKNRKMTTIPLFQSALRHLRLPIVYKWNPFF